MTDILETMRAEIAEAVELMRPHFPQDSEDTLIKRAESLRARRYQDGHWPDFVEMAKEMAKPIPAMPDDATPDEADAA